MKILGILLIIMGVFKGLALNNVSIKDMFSDSSEKLPTDPGTIDALARGMYIAEVILEIVCGLFIVFL